MTKIRVQFKGGGYVTAALRPDPTPTTEALLDRVPFSSRTNKWGDEVYFQAPFHADLEMDARAEMEIGEVAFWPDGDAIAIFFGRTPASVDDEPRAYSSCNIIGTLEGDISALARVKSGSILEVTHVA